MTKLKTFEEFDQWPIVHIFCVIDPGIEFKAEVRRPDGKVVYVVDKKKIENGVMHGPSDLSSLREYLVKKKKIKQMDEIVPAEKTPTTNAE